MARKPRIHFSGACYHVVARGNRRQKIFLQESDYRMYLRFLKEYKQQCRFILFAYILMPDHFHFLLEVNGTPLSRLMQGLQLRYSRNFNLKYRKKGHLFQGRYQAVLYEKEAYLPELSAYIHLNAVRSGLVNDPGDYPWSSYHEYVEQENKDGLVDTEHLLQHFSDSDSVSAETHQKYETFVLGKTSEGHREDYYQLKDGFFLGSDEFVNSVLRKTDYRPSLNYDISLDEIVSTTSRTMNIPVEMFYTPSRNRQGALGRSVAGYLARKLANIRVKSVAGHFERDPVVISQGINKLEKRLLDEKEIKKVMTRLEKDLTEGRKRKRV